MEVCYDLGYFQLQYKLLRLIAKLRDTHQVQFIVLQNFAFFIACGMLRHLRCHGTRQSFEYNMSPAPVMRH